jgi:hypothetical protein
MLYVKCKGYFVFLVFLFLVFSVVPFYAFLPAGAYWEIRTSLSNGEDEAIDVGFFMRGSYIKIIVYVNGGDNEITAYLKDPSQNILQQGLVENSGVLRFGAPKDGYYSLHLQNDFRLFGENNEQILVKVYYYFYRSLFWFSGVILVIVGIALLIYYEILPRVRMTSKPVRPAPRKRRKSVQANFSFYPL